MNRSAGFTLVELIMTMVIIGIISAVAIPRFFDADVFKARGFADQVQATLRYAQKVAIAKHRNVCVEVTAGTITLTIANDSGAAIVCGTTLALPDGENFITSPSTAITISALPDPVTVRFGFDALGKPFDAVGNPSVAKKTFTITATNSIYVEPETGYVHQ